MRVDITDEIRNNTHIPLCASGSETPRGAGAPDYYYGKDCPPGMVQVEFVGCPPAARVSDYGWKPTESAFLEVWVDGKRFRIDVGDFHDGNARRRGLHIVTDLGVGFEQTSMNAASVFLLAPASPPPSETPRGAETREDLLPSRRCPSCHSLPESCICPAPASPTSPGSAERCVKCGAKCGIMAYEGGGPVHYCTYAPDNHAEKEE